MTIPEYVVDKATKLQTIYDRIETVRVRFAAAKREAEITFLRSADRSPAAQRRFEETLRTLEDECRFLGRANIGGETMADADIERVKAVAARRYLDPALIDEAALAKVLVR